MGFCGCRWPSADDSHVIFASVGMCEKHNPLFAGGTDSNVLPLFERVIRVVEGQREWIREDARRFVE
jgi:hypothetical protein